MKQFVIAFILLAHSAGAFEPDDYISHNEAFGCHNPRNQDKWTLGKHPDPKYREEYLFTYTNNERRCTMPKKGLVVVSPDGFKVKMFVDVGVNEKGDERIYIIPEDGQYVPFPAELILPDDAREGKIRLIPGMM